MLLRSVSTVATRAVHRVDRTQTDPNNKYKYTSNINQVAQGLQEKQNVANEGLTVLTCRASTHTYQTLSLALLSISWLAKIRMTFLHPGGQSLLASRDPEPFDPPEGPCLSQAACTGLGKHYNQREIYSCAPWRTIASLFHCLDKYICYRNTWP